MYKLLSFWQITNTLINVFFSKVCAKKHLYLLPLDRRQKLLPKLFIFYCILVYGILVYYFVESIA
jgi:hypothetical protein